LNFDSDQTLSKQRSDFEQQAIAKNRKQISRLTFWNKLDGILYRAYKSIPVRKVHVNGFGTIPLYGGSEESILGYVCPFCLKQFKNDIYETAEDQVKYARHVGRCQDKYWHRYYDGEYSHLSGSTFCIRGDDFTALYPVASQFAYFIGMCFHNTQYIHFIATSRYSGTITISIEQFDTNMIEQHTIEHLQKWYPSIKVDHISPDVSTKKNRFGNHYVNTRIYFICSDKDLYHEIIGSKPVTFQGYDAVNHCTQRECKESWSNKYRYHRGGNNGHSVTPDPRFVNWKDKTLLERIKKAKAEYEAKVEARKKEEEVHQN